MTWYDVYIGKAEGFDPSNGDYNDHSPERLTDFFWVVGINSGTAWCIADDLFRGRFVQSDWGTYCALVSKEEVESLFAAVLAANPPTPGTRDVIATLAKQIEALPLDGKFYVVQMESGGFGD